VSGRYKLKFDLQSRSNPNNWYYAKYSTFRVLDETYGYKLEVAGYSGNAGYDAFGLRHNGLKFSTYDRDNVTHHTTVQHTGVVDSGTPIALGVQ